MNPIASAILWMSVQIALFSVVGFLALVLLRRRGPNAAAACCATVLGLTLPLAVMVVCPWPRWSIGAAAKPPVSDRGLNNGGAAAIVDAAGENRSDPTGAVSTAVGASPSSLAIWWQAAADWFRTGGQQQAADVSARATWQTYLPWLIAAGVGVCLVRLAAGVWAMSRLRRNSRVIVDETLRAELLTIIEIIHDTQSPAHRLTPSSAHSLRSVGPAAKPQAPELRETAALRSAATIGWRRPVLLLPSDWHTWTETERRVVLAHELAHVARRDYLTAVVARLATSIHFYQPLVLWLSRQLRIQQELAADNHAAAIAGSRQTYLTTLAQMALRADDQPLPWAARAFLPGTSMLIKRVAWLKQKENHKEMTMNRTTRSIFTVAMVAAAFAVAGLRGPGNESTSAMAAADDPKPVAKNSEAAPPTLERKPLRTFDYIPEDAKLVFVASPSVLLKSVTGQQLQKLIVIGDAEKRFGFTLREIEDIKVIQTKGDIFQSGPKPPFQRLVIRTTEPHDWKKWIMDKPGAKPKQVGDKTIIEIDGDIAFIPDDRTIVALIGYDDVQIKQIVLGAERLRSEDMSSYPALIYSPVAVWADAQSLKAGFNPNNIGSNPALLMLGSLLEQTKSVAAWASLNPPASGNGNERLNAALQLTGNSADAAKQSQSLLDAARTFLKLMGTTTDATERQQLDKLQPDQRKMAELKLSVLKLGMQFLDAIEIKVDGATTTAGVDFPVPWDTISSLLGPAATASREAAMRAASMNNMKQLALACHVYVSIHKNFPPAAIRDKDGKPLLSWRVAILPFIEEKPLYDQFHLDEPWDSEHNKALIAKMPAVLRDPHEAATSTNASYFMPTGDGTIGANLKGTRLKDITDGTSKTIMLVEAKREIPWTKPEDIEIDPDTTKPLPKFGGHWPEGMFGVAFADGSVHAFSQGVLDANMLRALLTIAGGEPVAIP